MLRTSKVLQMDWDPEALTDLANEAMSSSNSRNPVDFNWGLFAWGDAPAACCGGVGSFQWFGELSAVLSFVTDLSPAGFATFDDEDEWLELRDRLRQIANAFEADSAASISAFNDNLKTLLQLNGSVHLKISFPDMEVFRGRSGLVSAMIGTMRRLPKAWVLLPIQNEKPSSNI
jgi:hypothetical protein